MDSIPGVSKYEIEYTPSKGAKTGKILTGEKAIKNLSYSYNNAKYIEDTEDEIIVNVYDENWKFKYCKYLLTTEDIVNLFNNLENNDKIEIIIVKTYINHPVKVKAREKREHEEIEE